ncbi:MAG TPA: hypothetical protein ENI87_03085, partial [bacterium]|nr:hypothetical protein [bacterium]
MNKLVSTLTAGLFATSALAQACFDTGYGTSLGSANDIVHPPQPIGFAFPVHDGTSLNTYTDIHISDHGVCWLSNAGTPTPPAGGAVTYNVLLSDFVLYGPCIATFWADANCGYNVSPLGEVFINNTDPTKCVVTWLNMWTYQDQGPAYSFQLTLHASGEVTMVYDADTNNYGSTFAPNAIVGVTPGSGAVLPAMTDLSAALAPTTDPSIFEEFTTPSTFDLAADGFNLIPTNPGWVIVPLGGTASCAQKSTFGSGCISNPAVFHELIPAGAFDLGGTTITMLRTGSGYTTMDTIPGTILPPSPNAVDVAL